MWFKVEGHYFIVISLPFGLRWVASFCQNVTGLVIRHLARQSVSILNYIDDLGGGGERVHSSNTVATYHFGMLQATLQWLG